MNYQAFSDDSLTVMYKTVRGALASDDALAGLGEQPRFDPGDRGMEATRRQSRDGNAQARDDV